MFKIDLDKLYSVLLHTALSVSIFQLICPIQTLITTVRVDYICIIAMYIIICKNVYDFGVRALVKSLLCVCKTAKYLIVLCGVYFIWDSINIFYATDKFFLLDKYLIWSKMVALCLCVLLYVNPFWKKANAAQKSNNIVLNMGLTSCIISIVAYIGYYTGIFTYRIRMLTTISDHNVFSSMLMIGFIGICYLILSEDRYSIKRKMLYISLCFIICAPAMYLSASRRTIVLLYVFSVWFVLYCAFKIFKIRPIKECIRHSVYFALACIITIASFNVQVSVFNYYSTELYDSISEKETNDIQTEITEEHVLEEVHVDYYVETIADRTGLDLRKEIWKTSLKWFNSMNIIEKLVGGGGSYQSDIFNDIEHPYNKTLVEHYGIEKGQIRWMGPHNFLLEDLLTGGIIKLLIVISIMCAVLYYLLVLYKYDKDKAVMMLTLYAVLFANLMMGGKFGLFGDRLTWFVILLHVINHYSVIYYQKKIY